MSLCEVITLGNKGITEKFSIENWSLWLLNLPLRIIIGLCGYFPYNITINSQHVEVKKSSWMLLYSYMIQTVFTAGTIYDTYLLISEIMFSPLQWSASSIHLAFLLLNLFIIILYMLQMRIQVV